MYKLCDRWDNQFFLIGAQYIELFNIFVKQTYMQFKFVNVCESSSIGGEKYNFSIGMIQTELWKFFDVKPTM